MNIRFGDFIHIPIFLFQLHIILFNIVHLGFYILTLDRFSFRLLHKSLWHLKSFYVLLLFRIDKIIKLGSGYMLQMDISAVVFIDNIS